MHGIRWWFGAGLGVWVALAGCTRQDDEHPEPVATEEAVRLEAPAPEPDGRELDAAREELAARADSVRRALVRVRSLSRGERGDLRRDVNARQVSVARSLGVRAGGEAEVQRLVRQGRLVELEDSTQYWVLRDLEYSVPYVTPDTRAMLDEIGRRFHERLDSLDLPRYRIEVTSVLRTAETQAKLRRSNSNAAAGVSAHEYGTTLDLAHARFAAPAESGLRSVGQEAAPMLQAEALILEELARVHASGLQAELGRVLREMRAEGKLRVMMERRQAVYHITVARRFRGAGTAA